MAFWKFLALLLVVVVVAIEVSEGKKCFKQICKSNSGNSLRGQDSKGHGRYGAPRGKRRHTGVDIKCKPGDDVYAPFPSVFLRRARPYGPKHKKSKAAFNTGLLIKGKGAWKHFTAKIFYVKKSASGRKFSAGDKMGVYQKLTYRGITQHVHLQLRFKNKVVNPTKYLC